MKFLNATRKSPDVARLVCILLCCCFYVACDNAGKNANQLEACEPGTEVAAYLEECLTSWAEFVRNKPSELVEGDIETLPDVTVAEVVTVDDVKQNVNYACTIQPISLTDTPDRLIMYAGNDDILYPGALLEGKSHRDAVNAGELKGITIAERTPITISIGDIPSENNQCETQPTLAGVNSCRGRLLEAYQLNDLKDENNTPVSTTYQERTFHSEEEFALSLGVSGRYFGFRADASASVDREASKSTVAVEFFQKMYTVSIQQPQTPDAFFSESFTADVLQEQVALGRIGPDNLPVYVASVVYGRALIFTLTSTASVTELKAAAEFAAGKSNGLSGELEARYKTIINQAEVSVKGIGGTSPPTEADINSLKWQEYFEQNVDLGAAAPLSYTFKDLYGQLASVSETIEYNVKTCTSRDGTPPTFTFASKGSIALPTAFPGGAITADINADGFSDFVWNKVSGSSNQTVFATSNGDGTFSVGMPIDHPNQEGNWASFTFFAEDITGDGAADLIWNYPWVDNLIYTAVNDGAGNFTFNDVQVLPGSWGGYEARVADVDGDKRSDLILNKTNSNENKTYIALAQQNESGLFNPYNGDFLVRNGGFAPYQMHVGDVNNDEQADLIWTNLNSSQNRTWLLASRGTGSRNTASIFGAMGYFDTGGTGWVDYDILIGDVDGSNGDDIVYVKRNQSNHRIHRNLSQGNGSFNFQNVQAPDSIGMHGPFDSQLIDVNRDGIMDLVWNKLDGVDNTIIVGLGTPDGTFDFNRAEQTHPMREDWGTFALYTGDFNGDGFGDLAWTDNSNTIYVGLARNAFD